MNAWLELERELDRWRAAHRMVTLWWRDDDIIAHDEPLERLLSLSEQTCIPVTLAVIPQSAAKTLPRRVQSSLATVVQHGYAHRNHAPPGEKKAEFGTHRALSTMCSELEWGWNRLRGMFAQRFAPLLVPPWNRIHDALLPMLPSLGITGLSTFASRGCAIPAPGLRQTNCHVDLINWRHDRAFVGTGPVLDTLRLHLCARRNGEVDGDEPTGVLSHHRDHDAGCWEFLVELFARTGKHPAVRWLKTTQVVSLR